jgi:parvulin-like peptidyl-prolyl isomerase
LGGEDKESFVAKYENEIKKDYIIQQYFNNEILERIPKEEARAASHILVCYEGANLCQQDRTREEALLLIQEVKGKAESPNTLNNFATLAEEYSDGPSGESGGSLGVVVKGQMVPEFEEVLFDIEANTISEPVETSFGYHIIRVNSIQEIPNSNSAVDTLVSIKDIIINNVDFSGVASTAN